MAMLNNQMESILKKTFILGMIGWDDQYCWYGLRPPASDVIYPPQKNSSGFMKVSCWDVSKWYTIWLFNGLPWKDPPCY